MDIPEFELKPASSVSQVLEEFVQIIVKHPLACQAAMTALVKEGRAYIETPTGQNLAESLASSELLLRASVVWESASMGLLDEAGDGVLPSGYVDALFVAAGNETSSQLARAHFSERGGSYD